MQGTGGSPGAAPGESRIEIKFGVGLAMGSGFEWEKPGVDLVLAALRILKG